MSVERELVKRWNAQRGYYEWVETHPLACPNGHPWGKPHTMQPGWATCSEHGHGHRIWTCATCNATVANGHEDEPPAGPDRA